MGVGSNCFAIPGMKALSTQSTDGVLVYVCVCVFTQAFGVVLISGKSKIRFYLAIELSPLVSFAQ